MPKIPRDKRSKSQKKWYLHLARQKSKQKTASTTDMRLVVIDEVRPINVTNENGGNIIDDNHIDDSGKDIGKSEKDIDVISLYASDNDFD